jgi:hypothetical protein
VSDDTDYLLCAPNEEGVEIVTGSVLRLCTQCRREIWVSPSGLLMLATQNVVPVCPECGLKKMNERAAEMEIAPLTPEQIREIAAHWRLHGD